jgi:hypothetical protein
MYIEKGSQYCRQYVSLLSPETTSNQGQRQKWGRSTPLQIDLLAHNYLGKQIHWGYEDDQSIREQCSH